MFMDNDEEISIVEDEHYDQVLDIQQSDLHMISTRPETIPLSDVTRWVAHHTNFIWLDIVGDSGKVLGLLIPEIFQQMYQFKPFEKRCKKE